MNTDRIKEIQQETAYPESVSVQQALLKVWNETKQEQLRKHDVVGRSEQLKAFLIWAENEGYNITPFKDEMICDYIKSL